MNPNEVSSHGNLTPIRSWNELRAVVQKLSKEHPNKILLFRGQRQLHEHVRSGRARPEAKIHPEVEAGWCALVQQLLGFPGGSEHNGYVKAVLQHYGMATHYVDLTSDLEVAVWFATHDHTTQRHRYWGSTLRVYEEATYNAARWGSGYILVLAVGSPDDLRTQGKLFDLSQLPAGFLRPHRQKAWLMLDRPPLIPDPDSFLVALIELDCSQFDTSKLTTDLFPPPTQDAGYTRLLALPFAQDPLAYYPPHPSDKAAGSSEALHQNSERERFCLAYRALGLPEYVARSQDELVNHKWDDFTIYEPYPMRMWKNWRYPLETVYAGVKGDIRDATKLTVTPSAKKVLDAATDVACSWPQLGNEGLFFTFAAIDHDKVGDHCPPYYGVWLQRDDDLILEIPMDSDEEVLSVCPGHAYFLRNGAIHRQQMKNSCVCGFPDSHDQRVSAVLRLSALVSKGQLILLPHPTCSSLGWYLVLTGDDTSHVLPRVQSFHKAFKAAFRK